MPELKQEPPLREESKHKCIGFQEAIVASSIERRDKPHPWILQKIMIPVALAITGYAYYVYAVRMCIPMVRRKPHALGSRREGVAFLIVFHVLLVIVLWAYAKATLTPAGLARDHVPKCLPPEGWSPSEHQQDGSDMSYPTSIGGPEYVPSEQSRGASSMRPQSPTISGLSQRGFTPSPVPSLQNAIAVNTENEAPQTPPLEAGVESPAQAYARSHSSRWRVSQPHDNVDHLPPNRAAGNEVVEMDAIPIVTDDNRGRSHDPTEAHLPPLRHPPFYPALSPESRYCQKDEIIKPPRTHHCRICGTCVLMFDHHCPWIGQCVGAGNRRLFFLFCAWAFLFTFWMAVTLLIANVSHTNHRDPQGIGMIFVAALFSLFTGSLAISHFILIRYNSTTVEDLSLGRMRRRERAELDSHFGICQRREKRELRRQWDEEWGRLGTEGNLWWLGSAHANWEAMMGRNPWYWIFPVGGSFTNGLDFPRNPRFSEDGRWRRRAEWPSDV